MSDLTIKRIHSKGPYRHEEVIAAAALSPGHLIELTSAGLVQKQSTADGFAEAMFAEEDALQGRNVGTAYAEDELVSIILPQKASVVNVMLTAGKAYTVGMILCPKGDGTLEDQADSSTPKQAIGVCEVALDLSATGAVDTLSQVRII